MNADDHLTRLIPHRLDALAILALILELRLGWEEPKPMQILVDGRVQFEGLTSLFTNPIIEVGTLHIRALLEFIGLKAKAGALVAVLPGQRKSDDAGIELLELNGKPLQLVTPVQARNAHPESPALAEASLVAAINAANKGMAHLSTHYANNPVEAEQLLLAARLTQQLVERHVYLPLGRERPAIPIEAKPRL
ncbi:hypothetical protein [Roseateles sp. BYS87W]|uniref:Uncharacterized protein n=1 Tax=Pelomonas baiyunensis TaxID=3299026 RepID=A0ABW7GYM0_9BURK